MVKERDFNELLLKLNAVVQRVLNTENALKQLQDRVSDLAGQIDDLHANQMEIMTRGCQ